MIPRSLTQPAIRAFEQYPIVTLVGPRQSGKTTLARNAFDLPYVNLEAPDVRDFVQNDPRAFLADHPDGAIIDEIQRAPDLTSYLQVRVDETNRPGQFLLTGSHNFAVREQLSQSLAGRTALLTLLPFSRSELLDAGEPCRGYFNHIFTGGYPRIYEAGSDPTSFHRDYVGTYLERDLRQLSTVRNIAQFPDVHAPVRSEHRPSPQPEPIGRRLRHQPDHGHRVAEPHGGRLHPLPVATLLHEHEKNGWSEGPSSTSTTPAPPASCLG